MSRVRCVAGLLSFLSSFALCFGSTAQSNAGSFTLREALSAPYATDLTPAPAPARGLFAWVEDAEGRHNLWVGGDDRPARRLTHNTADDAQDITDLAWSADAKEIAFVYGAETGEDGRPANPAHLQQPTPATIIVQPLEKDALPIQLGEGLAPLFAPRVHTVLFVRGGQVWSVDLNAPSSAHQLVFDRGTASGLVFSGTGRWLAFISTRREGGVMHRYLALFDMLHSTLSFPDPSTGNDLSPSFVAGDKGLAWIREPFTEAPEYAPHRVSANPWSIRYLQLDARDDGAADGPDGPVSGIRTLYTPRPNAPGSVLPHMSSGEPKLLFPTAGTLVFSSETDGWNHLYALQCRTGPTHEAIAPAPRLLTPGPFEVEDPVSDVSEAAIYYSANDATADPLDADRRAAYRLSFEPNGPSPFATPQRVSPPGLIATHPHGARPPTVAILASDVREPMHPVLVSGQGSVEPFRPDRLPARYPGARFVTPRPVLLHTRDGLVLHAQLFEPPPNAPRVARRAALLFFHGGPNRQMLLGFPPMDYYSNAYAMNQYLCSRGFVVLSVNYRGGIGYGVNFRERDNFGPEGASEYSDALAAVYWLRAQPNVDAKRIGIWGGSYGGYLVALALARNSDLFAAGVDFHGVHEWSPTVNEPEPWLRGTPAEQAARAALAHRSSPMADIARWRSPVLLIHGDDDGHVSYNQTPMLADALRARNVPVEELIFPDETHGFLLHSDWLRAYEATAEFFERKLHPER